MPTYPYACTACGHAFEVQQSFSDPSLTECPECQGRLRKVFSSVGVVFKGSGFYRTDSRPGSGSKGESAAGAPSGGSDGASAGTANGTKTGTTSTDSGPSSSKPAATKPAKPAPAATGS